MSTHVQMHIDQTSYENMEISARLYPDVGGFCTLKFISGSDEICLFLPKEAYLFAKSIADLSADMKDKAKNPEAV